MGALWDAVWTAEWWKLNLGQILGAGVGAFLAYLFGAILTKKQIHLSRLAERIKHAKVELPFIELIRISFIDLEERLITVKGREEFNGHLRQAFGKVYDKWWDLLSNAALAEAFDNLLRLLDLLEQYENGISEAVAKGTDSNGDDAMEEEFEKLKHRHSLMVKATRGHIEALQDGLDIEEDKSRKLIGLNPKHDITLLRRMVHWFYFKKTEFSSFFLTRIW